MPLEDDFVAAMRRPVFYDPSDNPIFSFRQTPLGNLGGLVDMGYQWAVGRGMVPQLVSPGRQSGMVVSRRLESARAFQQMTEYQSSMDQQVLAEALKRQARFNPGLANITASGAQMLGLDQLLLQGGRLSGQGMQYLASASREVGSSAVTTDASRGMLTAFNAHFGFSPGQVSSAARTAGLSRDELARMTAIQTSRLTSWQRSRLEGAAMSSAQQAGVDAFRRFSDTYLADNKVSADVRQQARETFLREYETGGLNKAMDAASAIVNNTLSSGKTAEQRAEIVQQTRTAFDKSLEESAAEKGLTVEALGDRDAIKATGVLRDLDKWADVYATLGESTENVFNILETSFGSSALLNPQRMLSIAAQLNGMADALGTTLEGAAELMAVAQQAAVGSGGRRLTMAESLQGARVATAAATAFTGLDPTTAQRHANILGAAAAEENAASRQMMLGALQSLGGQQGEALSTEIVRLLSSKDPEDVRRGMAMESAIISGQRVEGFEIDPNLLETIKAAGSDRSAYGQAARNAITAAVEAEDAALAELPTLRRQLDEERAKTGDSRSESRISDLQSRLDRANRIRARREARDPSALIGAYVAEGDDRSQAALRGLAQKYQAEYGLSEEQALIAAAQAAQSSLIAAQTGQVVDVAAEQQAVLRTVLTDEEMKERDFTSPEALERSARMIQSTTTALGELTAGDTFTNPALQMITGLVGVGADRMEKANRAKVAERAMRRARSRTGSTYSRFRQAIADPSSTRLLEGLWDAENGLDLDALSSLTGISVSTADEQAWEAVLQKLALGDKDAEALDAELQNFSANRAAIASADSDEARNEALAARAEIGNKIRRLSGLSLSDEALDSSLSGLERSLYAANEAYEQKVQRIEGTLRVESDMIARIVAEYNKTNTGGAGE